MTNSYRLGIKKFDWFLSNFTELIALYKSLTVMVTSFLEHKFSWNKCKLEYNIIFPTIKKTERKPFSIREQDHMHCNGSKHYFNNVTYNWSCNIYSLKRELR